MSIFGRETELSILRKNVSHRGKVLVVGPMGDYQSGDPTLPLLVNVFLVNPHNIYVLDYLMDDKSMHKGATQNVATYGHIQRTRKGIRRSPEMGYNAPGRNGA